MNHVICRSGISKSVGPGTILYEGARTTERVGAGTTEAFCAETTDPVA